MSDIYGYYSRTSMDERLVGCPVEYTKIGNIIETATAADMKILYIGNPSPDPWEGVYNNDYTDPTIPIGTLLKDVGQTVEFNIGGLLAIRWNLVQFVNGPDDEGVPPAYSTTGSIWVVTYISDAVYYEDDPVGVVRVG